MDLTQKFRNIVRAIVGMPEDPGQPPQYDRMAWYRAQVTACASDGSTCDVQPEDPRISPENGVKALVGVPGAVAVVQPGAIVMLGWERGDPSRPRCMPLWESGASLTSLSIGSSPDGVATKKDLQALHNAISTAAVVAMDGGAAFKTNLLANLVTAGWSPASGDGRCASQTIKVQR